ncbi:unnamed protein product [Trichobilharzia regenti]|nr:unnamed protein product [Trichobilharzia regenti]
MLLNRLFLQSEHVKRKIWDGVSRAEEKLGGRLPTLDPIKDLNIMDDRIKQQSANLMKIERIRERMNKADSLSLHGELLARKRLLRRLHFCSEDDTIALKGRIACEISSGDEVILTELLLDGFFNKFSAAQLAGVMSCFVAEKQTKQSQLNLTSVMEKALRSIHLSF